jgi:hypothetical protein
MALTVLAAAVLLTAARMRMTAAAAKTRLCAVVLDVAFEDEAFEAGLRSLATAMAL